jgi:hypothetical protein
LYALGLAALGSFSLAAGPAAADSVGPYYATPSWDQTLPSSTRFIVLSNFNSEAVLDRETGLVWEKSPSTSLFAWQTSILAGSPFEPAQAHCNNLSKGNRKGWRLPTAQELASLVDPSPSVASPTLPSGHPFTNVQSSGYWSASSYEGELGNSSQIATWVVDFSNGNVSSVFWNPSIYHVWCVRGGVGVDAH